jgi:hypothetical protein
VPWDLTALVGKATYEEQKKTPAKQFLPRGGFRTANNYLEVLGAKA